MFHLKSTGCGKGVGIWSNEGRGGGVGSGATVLNLNDQKKLNTEVP